jgi:hypothetical protein
MTNLRRLFSEARQEVGLTIILVLQATMMFVLAPLSATGVLPIDVVEAFRFGLAAAAVLTITRSRPIMVLIVVSFVLSIVLTRFVTSPRGSEAVSLARAAVTTTFDLTVAVAVARVAFGPGRVSFHRILGGVVLYLSIGLIFANIYRVLALTLQPSFAGLPSDRHGGLSELLYFSLGTLTTAGAGDIHPIHPFVRSVANLEAVIGQLFPPTLLARLVSLHTSAAAARLEDEAANKDPPRA